MVASKIDNNISNVQRLKRLCDTVNFFRNFYFSYNFSLASRKKKKEKQTENG